MAIANRHHSSMRVAVVSASRIQRESLKTLIEDNGPSVVSAATLQDYLSNQEALHPDVLLIDLEHATDSELERVSDLVATSKIPVLFNESPTIPTMPGPYRDDWANNLIGKLVDLTDRDSPTPRGLLSRPRYVQSSAHRLPKVLVLSRSKTRRRVIELILINQGFQETNEAYFDIKYAAPRAGAVDAIVVDEHNVGPDEQEAFDAIVGQDTVPVYRCNSSQVPTSASERRLWGQKLAGQLIQMHKKRHPAPEVNRSPASYGQAAILARSDLHNDARDANAAAEHWGDRMAEKLAKLRLSIKSNHDDFMSDPATPMTASALKAEPNSDAQLDQPEPKKTVSIADQVNAHIEEAQQESALMQRRIEQELQRDLKYLRPETAAELLKGSETDTAAETAVTKSKGKAKTRKAATPSVPELKIVDASNVDDIPRTPHPGQHPASATPPTTLRDEQIARFFELNEQMARVDDARTAKLKKDAAEFSFDKLAIVDEGSGNPFVRKPAAKPSLSGSRPKQKPQVKPYRSKTKLARLINTLHDVKKLIPKIFN